MPPRQVTLGFKVSGDLDSAVDRKKGPGSTQQTRELAGLLKTAGASCARQGPASHARLAHGVHQGSRGASLFRGGAPGGA